MTLEMEQKRATPERLAEAFEKLTLRQKRLISGADRYGRRNSRNGNGWLFGPDSTHALYRPIQINVPKKDRPILFWCAYGTCTECKE